MEVRGDAVPGDFDVVAADELGFVVQRLRDVAEEVDQELERLFVVGGRLLGVLKARGVVCDGADDAAGGWAVAGQSYGAGTWRLVVGVDKAGEVGC